MMVLGLLLQLFKLLEKFLFLSSTCSQLLPKPIDSELSMDNDVLIKRVRSRWTLDENLIVRLNIDDLWRIVLLRYRLVILDFSLLPLGWRLDCLGLRFSRGWGSGDIFM